MTEAVEEVSKKIEDIRLKLLGDPEAGFQAMGRTLRGKIFMVARSISGYTGAPSEKSLQQMKLYAEQFTAVIKSINQIIDDDFPRLNKLMNENKIPHLLPVEKIKI